MPGERLQAPGSLWFNEFNSVSNVKISLTNSPVILHFNLKLIATEGILVLICSIISKIYTEKNPQKSHYGKDLKSEFQISHTFSMEQGR